MAVKSLLLPSTVRISYIMYIHPKCKRIAYEVTYIAYAIDIGCVVLQTVIRR